MRVAVIGAGFAGLAAAYELLAEGVDVHVFEARDRVGGRVWSESLSTPLGEVVIERGGEFVLDGYEALRSYAEQFALELVDTGMSYYRREPRGAGAVDATAMAEAGPAILAATQSAHPTSIDELLDGLGLPAELTEAIRCRVEISCALETRLVHVDVVSRLASLAPAASHRIAGGNQRLALALADRLPGRIHLGSPVRAIAWDDDGVDLRLDGGGSRFDRVVLAIPLPLVRELQLAPALPAWKAEALGRCAWGHAAKLHLPLNRAVAPSATMSVPDRYWSWTALAAGGQAPPVLNCFAGSPTALRDLGLEAGPDAWIERVRTVQPELPVIAEGAVLTAWDEDPWARGAYSVPGLDHSDDLAAAVQQPVGPVHFAGEYSAGPLAGLMEGALRSGRRSAAEILSAVAEGSR